MSTGWGDSRDKDDRWDPTDDELFGGTVRDTRTETPTYTVLHELYSGGNSTKCPNAGKTMTYKPLQVTSWAVAWPALRCPLCENELRVTKDVKK